MKHRALPTALLALAVIQASTAAIPATPDTTLSVAGSIEPGSCTFVGQLDFQFDDISATEFQHGEPTLLRGKSGLAFLECDRATAVGFRANDLRIGSAYDSRHFGLGHAKNGAPIGHYVLEMQKNLLGHTESTDHGAHWSTSTTTPHPFDPGNSGQLVAFTSSPGMTEPAKLKQMDIQIMAYLYGAPAETLDFSHALTMEGEASIVLFYL